MVDSVYEDSRREVLIDGEPELAGYSRTRNCFALVDIACSLSEPVADALFRVSDSDEADFLTGNADSSEVGCAFGQRGRSDGCLESSAGMTVRSPVETVFVQAEIARAIRARRNSFICP